MSTCAAPGADDRHAEDVLLQRGEDRGAPAVRLAVAGRARVPRLPREGRALGEDLRVARLRRIGEGLDDRVVAPGRVKSVHEIFEGGDPDRGSRAPPRSRRPRVTCAAGSVRTRAPSRSRAATRAGSATRRPRARRRGRRRAASAAVPIAALTRAANACWPVTSACGRASAAAISATRRNTSTARMFSVVRAAVPTS